MILAGSMETSRSSAPVDHTSGRVFKKVALQAQKVITCVAVLVCCFQNFKLQFTRAICSLLQIH